MCGILGITPGIDTSNFSVALNTLLHRGPDAYGIWQGGGVTLGHRRLSILDLSNNGKQPMMDHNGRFVIVFNGEIYNFLEIRNELEALGEIFTSGSDTEVLLTGFSRWGHSIFDRCNGMWAVAIWDCHEKKLFLSRDRFGKKPLFYTHIDGQFIFASEMKAIYPFLSEIKPSSNFAWLSGHLFEYEATSQTLIEGITRFPAGHHAWFDGQSLKFSRYWCTLDHLRDVPNTYEAQTEEFRELFLDSCRIRMRSDVALGTALSGGLDSTATLSAMAYIARNRNTGHSSKSDWQHAFVSSFPGSVIDETPFAKAAVDHLGIQGTFLEIDPLSEIDRLEEVLYRFEDIYLTNPIPMIKTYAAVRAHGTIVTLDGHGADELLGGYRGSLFEASGDANLREACDVLRTYRASFPASSGEFRNRDFGYPVLGAYWLYRKTRSRLGVGTKSNDAEHPAYNSLSGLGKHLYILFHQTILPTLLRNYDRYSMANGVEIRMPFMDHRLVTYCFSLPWQSLLGGGYTKRILRDSMAPFMPRELAYRRSKVGWGAPMTDWIKGILRPFFNDHLSSVDFKNCPVINPVDVGRQFNNLWENEKPTFQDGEKAWASIMPYFWWRSLRFAVRFP